MHVVIVTGEGEVTQADRLAGESFSLALPFVLVWTLWAVEVVTAEGEKWLALAGTHADSCTFRQNGPTRKGPADRRQICRG